jgi:hypothetical protein
MQHYVEKQLRLFLSEESLRYHEMAGTAYRQELGKALHDPQND